MSESLPATAYVAGGVVLAALITGFVSLVNLMVGKENKISEARLAWLHDLTADMSTMLSHIETLARIIQHELTVLEQATFDDTQLADLRSQHKEEYLALNEARYRIVFRLNPEQNQGLVAAIDDLLTLFRSGTNDLQAVLDKQVKVVAATHTVLRDTWKKVKDGEPAYGRMKQVLSWALIVLAVALACAVVIGVASRSPDSAGTAAKADSITTVPLLPPVGPPPTADSTAARSN